MFDQHIETLQAALKKLNEAKTTKSWLEYHLETKRKTGATNPYLERLINSKRKLLEAQIREYDVTLSQLVPENPIIERYEQA